MDRRRFNDFGADSPSAGPQLYGFSERQVWKATNYHLGTREFVGLSVDEAAPDRATLSDFEARLREAGGVDSFGGVGSSKLRRAQATGICSLQTGVLCRRTRSTPCPASAASFSHLCIAI